MNITIEIPDELAADLQQLADWHGVPVEFVILHAIAEDTGYAKAHGLGPWDVTEIKEGTDNE